LREWDFERDGIVELSGEWRFTWQEFVPPLSRDDRRYLTIPGYWNDTQIDGVSLPGSGFGTLALTILLPEQSEPLAIELRNISTAYSLFIDGLPITGSGKIATERDSAVPYYTVRIAVFTPAHPSAEVVLHVSNFHHRDGGIWEGLHLGTEAQIRLRRERDVTFEIFLITSIFVMGLYHLSLFVFRRKDKAALYFGLFCLIIALRSLVTGELYLTSLMPGLGWHFLTRVEYLSFYLALPLFLMYLRSIFPDEFSAYVLRTTQVLGLVFSIFVLVTPSTIYTLSVQSYQVITMAGGIYSLYVLFRAITRKREGALILLSAFIVLFSAVINDVLHANQIVHTGFFLPAGLWVFVFSQAILITQRFTSTFHTAELQSIQLAQTNEAYKREIAERENLMGSLNASNRLLHQSRIGLILGLAKLAECRDEDTGTHLERIGEYCRILAGYLAGLPQYEGYITEAYIADLYQSAILHDIGKVGVPDAVLLKPGKLTAEEFEVIKQHAVIGGDAIRNVEERIDIQSFLTLGKEIAYHHHEKWNGTGYPDGLEGEAIPLSARIVSLADVYDALTSERPYKAAFSHEKARAIIVEGRGSHFDPVIVDAFLAVERQFEETRRQFNTRESA